MTKADLVNAIALQTGYDKSTIAKVVDAGMKSIRKAVSEGDNVYLRSFGSFGTKTRAEKVARIITKKTTIIVPEHKVVFFKASPEFASMLR